MTRSTLLRMALGCAGLLGCAVLGAGIHRLGVSGTLAIVTGCVLAGAAASLGWHGIGLGFDRHEERRQAARRHRAPRPDRDEQRPAAPPPPNAAPVEPPPSARDYRPYAEHYGVVADDWYALAPAAAQAGQDLYAHPGRPA